MYCNINRIALVLSTSLLSFNSLEATSNAWIGFRGDGNSIASATNLPQFFGNSFVTWRALLEGKGQSSPVIIDELIFVSSVQGENKESLKLSCFSLGTGNLIWSQSIHNDLPDAITKYTSYAAPTPVLDTDAVYVFFETGVVAAYTHSGRRKWSRNLIDETGELTTNHGLGASPILTRNGLVILIDHDGQSNLISIDKDSGSTQWKAKRDTTSSWASPITHVTNDNIELVVCSASGKIISYNSLNGDSVWDYYKISGNNVPTLSIHGDYALAGSSRKNNTQLLKINKEGIDLIWRSKNATSSFGSPLIYNGRAYIVNKAGILFCHSLLSGKLLFDHRLPASTWASPMGNESTVFFFCKDGSVIILNTTDELKIVSESRISAVNNNLIYGYAAVNDHLVLRTESEILCFKSQ